VSGHDDRADQLPGARRRPAGPEQKGVQRDRALPPGARQDHGRIQRQQGNDEVRAGARVREIPAEGGLVPRQEVGEVSGRRPTGRQAGRDEGRVQQLPDRRPATDSRGPVLRADPAELDQLADVDQHGRLPPPLAKIDEEVGAARESLRRRVLRQERRRLEQRRRAPILEARQEHV
jgi:hypothetical protein